MSKKNLRSYIDKILLIILIYVLGILMIVYAYIRGKLTMYDRNLVVLNALPTTIQTGNSILLSVPRDEDLASEILKDTSLFSLLMAYVDANNYDREYYSKTISTYLSNKLANFDIPIILTLLDSNGNILFEYKGPSDIVDKSDHWNCIYYVTRKLISSREYLIGICVGEGPK